MPNTDVENLNKIVNEVDDKTDGCDFTTMRGKVIFGLNHKTEQRRGGAMHYERIGRGNAGLPPGPQRQIGEGPKTVDYGAPFEELLDRMEE